MLLAKTWRQFTQIYPQNLSQTNLWHFLMNTQFLTKFVGKKKLAVLKFNHNFLWRKIRKHYLWLYWRITNKDWFRLKLASESFFLKCPSRQYLRRGQKNCVISSMNGWKIASNNREALFFAIQALCKYLSSL